VTNSWRSNDIHSSFFAVFFAVCATYLTAYKAGFEAAVNGWHNGHKLRGAISSSFLSMVFLRIEF
jgi:hypothetical protein